VSFFYFGLLFLEIMVNVSTTNFGYHVMYFGVLREEKKVESILLLYVWDAEVRNIVFFERVSAWLVAPCLLMLAPGVSSTIGIRAEYLDRVTPSLLPARCFGYLGGLEIFTSEDEGSVFFERVRALASSTLSLDASTWGQFYYSSTSPSQRANNYNFTIKYFHFLFLWLNSHCF
jgi:hypothetical protein